MIEAAPTARVVYTDPPWLIDGRTLRPELATIETDILGTDVELGFGPYGDGRYLLTGDELASAVAGAAAVVIYRCQVTPELVNAAGPQLRAVIRQGVGTDNLNAAFLSERGILAYNIPDYCVDEASVHTAALILALERQIIPQHRIVTGGHFDIYGGGVPRRLARRTLGIVGFGRIGRAVCRKLGPFYERLLVHDPYLGRDLPEGYGAQPAATLRDLLSESDVVTLHCPLTDETAGLINDQALRCMRPGAYLVNAARGGLVDPVALGDALRDERIAGAALDVFVPENPHHDPAWKAVLQHPAVVVTSHRAFLSEESEISSRRRAAELARDVLDGQPATIGRV